LLNVLTKKWVLAEDKLFATLWTNIWKMYIKPEEISENIKKSFRLKEYEWLEILLNDTIGFIRDLPPNLIEAFRSTLEDSIESDLLLHVVDISDPKIEEKIKIVDDILENIWANQSKIYVFNKVDLLSDWHLSCPQDTSSDKFFSPSQEKEEHKIKLIDNLEKIKNRFPDLEPILISSYKKTGLDKLKDKILLEIIKSNK
jgi:GTP-binding protein HflX